MLTLHDRTSVELVASALHLRSLRYVIGVTDAGPLARDQEVLRAFATTRPQLFRRAVGGKRRLPAETPRIGSFAVWSAPLSELELEGGARVSLVTVVEKARLPGVEPLCLHLVTGEPVTTRSEVASVFDAYLARSVEPDLLDAHLGSQSYATA